MGILKRVFEKINPFLNDISVDDLSIENPTNVETITNEPEGDLSIILRNTRYGNTEYSERKLNYIEYMREYHKIAASSYGEQSINEIVNEMYSPISGNVIKIDVQNIELSKAIKNKIIEASNEVFKLLDFKNNGTEILKKWYTNGIIILEAIYKKDNTKTGIEKIAILKSNELQVKKDSDGKLIYKFNNIDTQSFFIDAKDNTPYNKEQLVVLTSGLKDYYGRNIGFLHSAIKPYNQTSMIEDLLVLYRLSRGSEKRVFKVNVGKMSSIKAANYMTQLINKFSHKKQYNPADGSVTNDSHLMSLSDDYWLPTKNSTKDIEIDTLQGGAQLGEITDLEYFRDKLYDGLKVPKSRFQEGAQSDFTATEVERDEARFLKYIVSLRNKFNYVFIELIRRHIVAKGIMSDDDFLKIKDNISIIWPSDNSYIEGKQLSNTAKRIDLLNDMKDYVGTYFSNKYIQNKVLNFTDGEIQDMNDEIDEEKKSKRYETNDGY